MTDNSSAQSRASDSPSAAPAEPPRGGGAATGWILGGLVVVGVLVWWSSRALDEPPPTPDVEAEVSDEPEGSDLEAEGNAAEGNSADELLARALEFEAAGDVSAARQAAQAAVDAGGARDAKLLLAKLMLLQGEPAAAIRPLEDILRTSPDDADALYNLGLAWQQHPEPDYNKSRNAYLATLRAAPRYAAARYNLVVLCVSSGIIEEARHHAALFKESFPQDPRGAQLDQLLPATPPVNGDG